MGTAEISSMEVDLSQVPLRPIGLKQVRELEIALVIASIFRKEVFDEILKPSDFTTWLDSLAIAAGALAREKAGYPIAKIAEELGRSESTIRNHLQGKTKAGKIVRETYDTLRREGGRIKLYIPLAPSISEELEKLKTKLKDLEERMSKARSLIEEAAQLLG
ncbi:MAG: transcriptional regulator [Desulfurococcales archaeon]|nr:transcriptional regulator [Desulfurococcales archaeon]